MEEPGQRYPSPAAPACLHVVVALLVSKASRPQATTILSCTCCLWWCRLCLCAWPWPRLTPSHPSIQSQGNPSPPSRVRRHVPSPQARPPLPPSGAAATMAPTRRPTRPRLLPLLLLVALVLALGALGSLAPQGTQVQAAFIPSSTQAPAFMGRAGALGGSQTLRTTRPCGKVRAHCAGDTCPRLATHSTPSNHPPTLRLNQHRRRCACAAGAAARCRTPCGLPCWAGAPLGWPWRPCWAKSPSR